MKLGKVIRKYRKETNMTFKEADPVFVSEMRENLKKNFADEETFGFMKEALSDFLKK